MSGFKCVGYALRSFRKAAYAALLTQSGKFVFSSVYYFEGSLAERPYENALAAGGSFDAEYAIVFA